MSTRSTVHFHYGEPTDKPTAIIYRHCGGYPAKGGMLDSLSEFFADVQSQTKDTRFNDPSYLAAKFVVWQAGQYRAKWDGTQSNLLDFLSLGVLMDDPSDIEYRYHVCCGDHPTPKVLWQKVRYGAAPTLEGLREDRPSEDEEDEEE